MEWGESVQSAVNRPRGKWSLLHYSTDLTGKIRTKETLGTVPIHCQGLLGETQIISQSVNGDLHFMLVGIQFSTGGALA